MRGRAITAELARRLSDTAGCAISGSQVDGLIRLVQFMKKRPAAKSTSGSGPAANCVNQRKLGLAEGPLNSLDGGHAIEAYSPRRGSPREVGPDRPGSLGVSSGWIKSVVPPSIFQPSQTCGSNKPVPRSQDCSGAIA